MKKRGKMTRKRLNRNNTCEIETIQAKKKVLKVRMFERLGREKDQNESGMVEGND